ncbi:hypothetical protein [Paractinoplanes maris]|uniref:hypothetical protein n=1 Tax=Paractinoplanes maris TaxID=1734446 RepID=UPI0020224C73|nr:hypothetical protein [Actinoplanes maris]
MAVIALVLSVVAVAVAVLAFARSSDGSPVVAQPAPATAPTTASLPRSQEPPPPGASAEAPAEDPGATGTIDPQGAFTRAYQDERLRAESPGCADNGNYQVAIDLDLPQVAGGGVDVRYSGCNPGTIQSELQQAEVSGPDATPEECLDKIRTQPASRPIPAAKDLTLCFRTDKNRALEEATTQKIVFMTITGVTSANDRGILNITLNAWNVP